jgi:MmyB-like transcription regulator ligand binding domain
MHHPQVAELELHYENLQIAGTDGQTLILYHADPRGRTAQALANYYATTKASRSSSAATATTNRHSKSGRSSCTTTTASTR